MAARRLKWVLCDENGAVVAPLEGRLAGGDVKIAVNAPRTATFSLSIDDDLLPLITPASSRLKVYLGDAIIFNGLLFLLSYEAGADGRVALGAADNLRLLAAFGPATQTVTGGSSDQSESLWRAIWGADVPAGQTWPGHGITRGSTPATVARPTDPAYGIWDGTQVWEKVLEYTTFDDGVDVELEPLDNTNGNHARVNTYARPAGQGTDKSQSVRLEYGVGANNCADFGMRHTGEQLVNTYTIGGATANAETGVTPLTPGWTAEDAVSIALYGRFEGFEVDTGINVPWVAGAYDFTGPEGQKLKQRAEAMIRSRARPLRLFDATPAVEKGGAAVGWIYDELGQLRELDGVGYGVPPVFGPDGDYWLGDTITVVAKQGQMSVELKGRVVAVVIAEPDESGTVVVTPAFVEVSDEGVVSSSASALLTMGASDAASSTDFASVDTDFPVDEDASDEDIHETVKKKKKKPKHKNLGGRGGGGSKTGGTRAPQHSAPKPHPAPKHGGGGGGGRRHR